MNKMASSTSGGSFHEPVVFLIHGVGNTMQESMLRAVEARYPNLPAENVKELVWNEAVEGSSAYQKLQGSMTSFFAPMSTRGMLVVSRRILDALHLVRSSTNAHSTPKHSKIYYVLDNIWIVCVALALAFPILANVWNWIAAIANSAAGLSLPSVSWQSSAWLPVLSFFVALGAVALDACLTGVLMRRKFNLLRGGGAFLAVGMLRATSLMLVILVPVTVATNFLLRVISAVDRWLHGENHSLPQLGSKRGLAASGPRRSVVSFLAAHSLIYVGLVYLLSRVGQDAGPRQWLLFALLAIGILGLHIILGATVKILADIFYYTTNLAYRNRLQKKITDEVGDFLEKRPSVTKVIFAAHSLGSVIALDYLWNAGAALSQRHVVLITGGSPLNRFFYRFFPGLYFPPSAVECVSGLSRRFRSFAWHNFHRPFDYVGMKLGLPSIQGCSEQVVWSFGWLHLNYWGDKVLATHVRERLDDEPITAADVPWNEPTRHDYYLPSPPIGAERVQDEIRSKLQHVHGVAILVFTVVALCLYPFFVYQSMLHTERVHLAGESELDLLIKSAPPKLNATVFKTTKEAVVGFMGGGAEPRMPILRNVSVYNFYLIDGSNLRYDLPEACKVKFDQSALERWAASKSPQGENWNQIEGCLIAGPLGADRHYVALDFMPARDQFSKIEAFLGSSLVYIIGIVSVSFHYAVWFGVVLILYESATPLE